MTISLCKNSIKNCIFNALIYIVQSFIVSNLIFTVPLLEEQPAIESATGVIESAVSEVAATVSTANPETESEVQDSGADKDYE